MHSYDARETAAFRVRPDFDERRMRLRMELDEDTEYWVPARWEVCSVCSGRGTVVDPTIDAGGITREDFDEDPDFEEAYFSGVYNISCPECQGRRVVPVVNESTCDPRMLREWKRQEEQRWAEAREDAHACRMGY